MAEDSSINSIQRRFEEVETSSVEDSCSTHSADSFENSSDVRLPPYGRESVSESENELEEDDKMVAEECVAVESTSEQIHQKSDPIFLLKPTKPLPDRKSKLDFSQRLSQRLNSTASLAEMHSKLIEFSSSREPLDVVTPSTSNASSPALEKCTKLIPDDSGNTFNFERQKQTEKQLTEKLVNSDSIDNANTGNITKSQLGHPANMSLALSDSETQSSLKSAINSSDKPESLPENIEICQQEVVLEDCDQDEQTQKHIDSIDKQAFLTKLRRDTFTTGVPTVDNNRNDLEIEGQSVYNVAYEGDDEILKQTHSPTRVHFSHDYGKKDSIIRIFDEDSEEEKIEEPNVDEAKEHFHIITSTVYKFSFCYILGITIVALILLIIVILYAVDVID